jgi:ribosomal protein S18 acetylase RimI-like enzyme
MQVEQAEGEADVEEVRRLFRAFVSWHHERHTSDAHLIDAYFDDTAWQRELAGLPGDYAAPGGSLLLARQAGVVLGCIAAHPLDDETTEMKRLFVAPTARHHGAGRALAEELMTRARAGGYRRMMLDTSVRQTEAIALYRSLGFVECEAYHDVPEQLLGWLVFFRLDL